MSITYRTRDGDTFDSISRAWYGTAEKAGQIRRANPGASEPFVAGIELVIPNPSVGRVQSRAPFAADVDDVSISVDGVRMSRWDGLSLVDAMDKVDTAEFDAPFDPDDSEMRRVLRPFGYQPVSVFVGDEKLFSGTLVNVSPVLSDSGITVSLGAYSLPGVLDDCTPPVSGLPVEYNGLRLDEIAQAIADPFGVEVVFEADPGPAFEKAACSADRQILSFLTELARQRGLIATSDAEGRLIIRDGGSPEGPVDSLEEGEARVLSVEPSYNGQRLFSHVSGVEPTLIGEIGPAYTVKNPRLRGVFRPMTFVAQDSQDSDVTQAAQAKAGRMYGNVVSVTLRVAGWRDRQGRRWRSRTTLNLRAPSAMIYSPYEFLVRRVELTRDTDGGEAAVLNLVLPGSFNSEIPESLPWDE